MVIPDDGPLRVLLHRFVVACKLGVDLRSETWELCPIALVVDHALRKHLGENVDRSLKIAVAFNHNAEDEVLEISVRLLLLLEGLENKLY